jgi:hypothetical protein
MIGAARLSICSRLARHDGNRKRRSRTAYPREITMKYMLLLFSSDEIFAQMPAKEQGEAMAAYGTFGAALTKAGALVASNRLRPASTATTVRSSGSDFKVMDGPFAESKEELGGFYLTDVPDLDAALKWAKQCPGARHGVVEVRPIWEM